MRENMTTDEAFEAHLRAVATRRQIERLQIWYRWWTDIACDLAAVRASVDQVVKEVRDVQSAVRGLGSRSLQ